jgi:biotin-dependent carboxylase-like uncharacterized protein
LITIVKAGPLTTVQDRGRPGFAHLGVPRSGALDQPALHRANTLAGNDPGAAALETTLLGCKLRFDAAATVAVTGATCTVKIDGRPIDPASAVGPIAVPAGAVVEVGRATAGVRSYVAVAGGIDVEPVLGSRSTDTLSGLGPPRLTDGQVLPIGPARRSEQGEEGLGDPAAPGEITLGVWLGPRNDWVEVAGLFGDAYAVSPVSNRVACRLAGTGLPRARAGELPPEGLVLGAIQVPPDGQPLIFLADHPTTGGYPVIGVVDDVAPLAQARPGTSVRFRELH